MGLPARIATVILGSALAFLVFLIVLGVILAAFGHDGSEPKPPVTPSASPTRPATSDSSSAPTVTQTATVTASPTPSPPATFTTTMTAEPEEPAPEPEEPTEAPPPPVPQPEEPPAPDVYYENCDAAREAGDTPLHEGDPGYAPHLDRDGDGEACEW